MEANKKNSFNVILEDGQMKRVEPSVYKKWHQENGIKFRTTIVQPERGRKISVLFKGDDFHVLCQDPQVWHVLHEDMAVEDYEELKLKHDDIPGIDKKISDLKDKELPPMDDGKDLGDYKVGDEIDIDETPLVETFATQSETLQHLQNNYITVSDVRAYFLGIELPFKY